MKIIFLILAASSFASAQQSVEVPDWGFFTPAQNYRMSTDEKLPDGFTPPGLNFSMSIKFYRDVFTSSDRRILRTDNFIDRGWENQLFVCYGKIRQPEERTGDPWAFAREISYLAPATDKDHGRISYPFPPYCNISAENVTGNAQSLEQPIHFNTSTTYKIGRLQAIRYDDKECSSCQVLLLWGHFTNGTKDLGQRISCSFSVNGPVSEQRLKLMMNQVFRQSAQIE